MISLCKSRCCIHISASIVCSCCWILRKQQNDSRQSLCSVCLCHGRCRVTSSHFSVHVARITVVPILEKKSACCHTKVLCQVWMSAHMPVTNCGDIKLLLTSASDRNISQPLLGAAVQTVCTHKQKIDASSSDIQTLPAAFYQHPVIEVHTREKQPTCVRGCGPAVSKVLQVRVKLAAHASSTASIPKLCTPHHYACTSLVFPSLSVVRSTAAHSAIRRLPITTLCTH